MSSTGASFNAFTTDEYICYYGLVLKKDLPLAMYVKAGRIGTFNVTQGKINTEKYILLEEIRMRFGNHPNNLFWEEMYSAFCRTGYCRSIIGWESNIKT